jgi:hypothetical protein
MVIVATRLKGLRMGQGSLPVPDSAARWCVPLKKPVQTSN